MAGADLDLAFAAGAGAAVVGQGVAGFSSAISTVSPLAHLTDLPEGCRMMRGINLVLKNETRPPRGEAGRARWLGSEHRDDVFHVDVADFLTGDADFGIAGNGCYVAVQHT